MIVYHFTSSEFALKALRDRRLKIARINEMNDPFQLRASDFSDEDTRTKLEAFKHESMGSDSMESIESDPLDCCYGAC